MLDADKQMAINVFLGVFQPQEGEKNVWELSTDYYLHHTLARVLPQAHSTFSHTKWWDDQLLQTLPLPIYRGRYIHVPLLVCVPLFMCVCFHKFRSLRATHESFLHEILSMLHLPYD